MKKPWIVVTRKVANEAIELLESAGEVDVCQEDAPLPRAVFRMKMLYHNRRPRLEAEAKSWAAGLDVFSQEPVSPDHPLHRLPNLTALPHIGSATLQARAEMARLAAANIVEVRDGREPLTSLW